jgi:predicted DNA-binding transcriptional regulator YafY
MNAINIEHNETLIEQAIESETPISFRYWKEDPAPGSELPARRVVSPYEIREGREGNLLLVCWSHGSEAVRFFNLDKIGGVQSEEGVEDFIFPVEA